MPLRRSLSRVLSLPIPLQYRIFFFFFFNDTATTEIYTLSLHDALPIYRPGRRHHGADRPQRGRSGGRSEEHTSELQSQSNLVCRLLLEKKKEIESVASSLRLALPADAAPPL